MKHEAFKNFVKTKPELIKFVQNGKMTWQKFYELYDLYGEDEKVWNKYILGDRSDAFDSISKITDMVKNVDVDSIKSHINTAQKAIDFVTDLTKAILKGMPKTLEDAMNLDMNGVTVNDALIALIAKIGEKISFRRFKIVEKNDDEVFGVYNHQNLGKINVIALIKGDNVEVARDVAMHSAAMRPPYVTRKDVPSDILEHEKEIIKKQAMEEGKPAEIAEKMVNGRINKFYKEKCLLEQPFIKDPDVDVATYVKNNNSEIIEVVRFEVGEGIEKRVDDFASEVMSQIKG